MESLSPICTQCDQHGSETLDISSQFQGTRPAFALASGPIQANLVKMANIEYGPLNWMQFRSETLFPQKLHHCLI